MSGDDENDLLQDIRDQREVLSACPQDHPDRAMHAQGLGWLLYNHYQQIRDITLLDEAIELEREALALQPPGHPDRALSCGSLAVSLNTRYKQCGDLGLLDEAIQLEREALALRPPGHPKRADTCVNLAVSLRARCKECGDLSLLDEAIQLEREALDLEPPGHPNRALSCASLAVTLRTRYEQGGDLGLLDEAIQLQREALALRPPGHPDRALICANLADSLRMRYKQCGDLSLLDEAIQLEREALALLPPGHPNRAAICANLGSSLHARYQQCGDISLLDEAIQLEGEALTLRPPGHPDRALSCANLADSLRARYKQCGDLRLLDEAIQLEREALDLEPQGHPNRVHTCGNLSISLTMRYEQCGDLGLLDEAIHLTREAVALRPPGHPDQAFRCDNLAAALHTRYEQGGDLGLLDEAIQLDREALALRPPGHPNRASSCVNLGWSLQARYKVCGDPGLLDEAIQFDREALALQSPGYPHRSLMCRNLSISLIDYYRHTKNTALLDEAIETCGRTLEQGTSMDDWRSFDCLASVYIIPDTSHFSLASALRYLDLSFGSECDNVHDFIRETSLNLSNLWNTSSVWASDTPLQLCNMYAQLIDRLPLAAGFVLDNPSRLLTLKSSRRIGTEACVVAILANQPSQAIELLDRAHGIVWAQALHQRDPQMEGAPPGLVAELADHLRAIAAPTPTPLDQSHQEGRHKRNTRIQAILRAIRAAPGSERFMLGNTYATIREVARKHPVVVLVAGRGHAFALIMSSAAQDQPHALRLEITSDELLALRVSAEAAGLRSKADMRDCESGTRIRYQKTETDDNHKPHLVLREIWRKVIQPVLRYLQLEVRTLATCDLTQLIHMKQKATGRSRPRIHWCANGDFVFLPLHAAGIYSGPQANRECCSDYIVSSYTPTVSALLRAQAQTPSVRSADVNMLLVGEDCANNSALSKLWNVRKELTSVDSIATAKNFGHTVEMIARDATVERVTKRIKSASFVHLACHGLQHRTNALESGFYLNDDKLTISKLMELELDRPWFAYLSACETAKGDAEQPDQVMHLAAAMLFAGFKHVVATMW
jgi:tetratricopeptide (TPR) repeat protein